MSLSPDEWAVIATSASEPTSITKSFSSFYLPNTLRNNSFVYTPLIAGLYDNELHILDTYTAVDSGGGIYYTNIEDSTPSWSTVSESFPTVGNCFSGKCFTQIDNKIYIIYDFMEEIIVYNLQTTQFDDSLPITGYGDVFCLSNNVTHIFGVGLIQTQNVLIYEISSGDIILSDEYIPNGQPIACSINTNDNDLYLFSQNGIFQYYYDTDYLLTLFGNNYEIPLFPNSTSYLVDILSVNITAYTPPLYSATDVNENDGLIWIKDDSGKIYPFSTITNRFLTCRAEDALDYTHETLFFINDYLFALGGAVSDEYYNQITLIDTSFLDDRLTISDYYYPNQAIKINYTQGFVDYFEDEVSSTKINLKSLDFDVNGTVLFIGNPTYLSGDDPCQVCYDCNNLVCTVGSCGSGDRLYCLSDGLEVELKMGDTATINADDDIDIKDIIYSIEASTDTSAVIANSADEGFVCNSFPIFPVYLVLNATLFSDDYFYLSFDYEYQCNGCSVDNFNDGDLYPFTSEVTFNSEDLGLDDDLTIKIVNDESCIITDADENEFNCSNYTLSYVTEIYFDGTYVIDLSSSDTYLESSEILLGLSPETTGCRSGSGYDEDTESCSLCLDGSFNLRNDLSECISCDGLEGVTCDGSNIVTVQYRYWVSGYRYSADEYITLFEIYNGTDEVLISHICAFGQCCDEIDGCDYVEYYNDDALCSNNRDLTRPMCTRCIDDYYELLSTNDCGECDYYKNMPYLIGTFSIAFVLVFYFSFVDAKPLDIMINKVKYRNRKDSDCEDDDNNYEDDESSSYEVEESDDNDYSDNDDDYDGRTSKKVRKKKKKKYKKSRKQKQEETKSKAEIEFSYFVADSYIANSALIFQIFVYYFQGYAEILSAAGSRAYLSPIINFFNFNFANDRVGSNGDGSSAGFCAIPFSTALSEIMMTLIFPGFMLFSLMLIYSFCTRGCGTSYYTRPYVTIAFFRIYIIIIGLLFRVLMQLFTCTNFYDEDEDWENKEYVQFYYDEPCFGPAWWVALFSFIIIFIHFIQMYWKLFQQTDEERYALNCKYVKLVQAYKPEYWYWEAVTTTRRFTITMFVTLSFIGGGYSNLILCLILIFYLIAHLTVYPWKHKRNNRIDTFCLLALLIGFIGINFDDIANSLFLSLFLGIVIFMPIIIALYYLFKLCMNCKRYWDGDTQYYIDSQSKYGVEDKMAEIKMRVLAKRDSYRISKKELDLAIKKPDGDDDGYSGTTSGYGGSGGGKSYDDGIMMTSYPKYPKQNSKPTKDGNHSDSSCGLAA